MAVDYRGIIPTVKIRKAEPVGPVAYIVANPIRSRIPPVGHTLIDIVFNAVAQMAARCPGHYTVNCSTGRWRAVKCEIDCRIVGASLSLTKKIAYLRSWGNAEAILKSSIR